MLSRIKLHNRFIFPSLPSRKNTSTSVPCSVVPQTSLSSPPWAELQSIDQEVQQQQHAEVVSKVNSVLSSASRLFAVVQFSGRQWKVTSDDLILIENHLDAQCGDRIRMEKVLMVGGEDFTLIGRPLLGCHVVRVEATILEKTESWPKVVQRFRKRKRHERRTWMVQPQTVLRINTIEVAPVLT